MRPTDFIIRAVLACTLLAAFAGAQAAAEARSRTRFDAMEAALQRRLSTPEAARVFREYNAAHGQQIQQNLAVVYGRDPDFAKDAGAGARPLGDSIVGPVTLKWLTQFCKDYGIVATDPDFAQDVAASLEHVATIARAHPDWVAILDSPDFDDWIAAQPAPERQRSMTARRSGAAVQVNALIAQYQRERHPPAAKARFAEPIDLTYGYDPKRLAGTDDLQLIGRRLRALAKQPPEDEPSFDADLKQALDGVAYQDDTLALIKRYSRVDAYGVEPDLLLRLKQGGLAEPAVIELRTRMENLEYDSAPAFEEALAGVIEGSEMRDALERSRRAIVLGARLARYQVPATLVDDLAADAPLAPAVAAVFDKTAGVQYPTRSLFDSALPWQVQRALGMCRDPERDGKNLPQGALDDKQVEALRQALPGLDAAFADIGRLRNFDGRCKPDQQLEADKRAQEVYLRILPLLARKLVLQQSHAMPPAAARADEWAVPDCACGRHARDGAVIGFYPLWTDGAGRQVNFGTLTRLDLYGLTMDDDGGLRGPRGMNGTAIPADLAALMKDAHRHHVGVDWVVARDDWSAWSTLGGSAKLAVLETLKANIMRLLERPLPDGNRLLVTLGSLGLDRGPSGGDGVALYFRHFPQADRLLYDDFVLSLSAMLKKASPARHLSLIVDYDSLGSAGPFDLRNLIGLIEQTNQVPPELSFAASLDERMDDLPVLVMLPEPTRDTKKALRGKIQETLRGKQSARLLRTLVPVLEYDGVGADQLADDIIYAQDNYFGIGFWPLPFARADKAGEVGIVDRLVSENFERNDAVSPTWHRIVGMLCPQRLWLRWVFLISLATALGVGVYYYRCRGCSERLDDSALYFGAMTALAALPALILLLLVVSDPVLESSMYVLLILYVVGGLAVAALTVRHYFYKSRRKLP